MRVFSVLLVAVVLLSLTSCASVRAESQEEMHRKRMAQEVGKHGPLNCGMTFVEFRSVTESEMEHKISAQSREKLFATPDGKPYPFGQLYVDDLIEIRDLLLVDDDANKSVWDERIKTRQPRRMNGLGTKEGYGERKSCAGG